MSVTAFKNLMRNLPTSVRRTVGPTITVVSREEAKEELDIVDDDTVNGRVDRLILQATEMVERDARRCLLTQTWQMFLDRFPCDAIELRKVPVASLSSIKYYTSEVLTTWASGNYHSDLVSEPARIEPISGTSWPTTDIRPNAVQIEWVSGVASRALLDAERPSARGAVLLALRHGYFGCELSANYWSMIERLRPFGIGL